MPYVSPYFLTRIGGEPIEILDPLKSEAALALAKKIYHKKQKRTEIGKSISDALYLRIPELPEEHQKAFLNLKRNAFNGRSLKLEGLNLKAVGELSLVIRNYQNTLKELDKLEQEYLALFPKEAALSREGLKKAAQSNAVQLGISLSSQILLNNLQKFLDRPSDAFRKKELKAEESLLKYITRTCSKTSPFSFFTQLALGKINAQTFGAAEKGPIESHTTLNNNLLSFFKAVLVEIPEIANHIKVRLNPTVLQSDSQVLYLTNNHNIEAFQRIEYNALIELFSEFFGTEYPNGIAYGKALDALIEGEYVDASRTELAGFIQSLFSYGLLEWDFEVSGIDPFWDKKLIAQISKMPSSEAGDIVIAALRDARTFAEGFGEIPAAQRWGQLKSTFDAFKTKCLKLHEIAGLPEMERLSPEEIKARNTEEEGSEKEEAGQDENKTFTHKSSTYFHFKQEQFLYEDVLSDFHLSMEKQEADELLEPLFRLYPVLAIFDPLAGERERMQHFVKAHFKDQKTVSLLAFYEAYYREVKVPEYKEIQAYKEEAKKNPKTKKPDFKFQPTKTEEKQVKAKADLKGWISENARLEDHRIIIETDGLAQKTNDKKRSHGMFIQPFKEGSKLKGVINGTFTGYGKMFSRFLHLFPEEVTETLVSANLALAPDAMYLENVDASYFNANLHPPLLKLEIKTPGGHNSVPSEQQIPVTDIDVNCEGENIFLKHRKSGKRISIFDLGFQGNKGRSELYQLLCRFTDAQIVHFRPIVEICQELFATKDGESRPSIWLDDKLCIQRQTWLITKENVPVLPQHFSEGQCYQNIIEWKESLQLPQEIFIRITSHAELENMELDQRKEVGRDAYKPQYIDFAQIPLVVNLFKKLLTKVPSKLHITEMLPQPKHMLKTEHGTFVNELMMQWYD